LITAVDSARCALCGGALDMVDRRFPGGRPEATNQVFTCTRCGSAQVSPMPAPETAVGTYSEEYFQSYLAGPGVKGGDNEASPGLRAVLKRLEALQGKGTIVDVGCAMGHFVGYAAGRGWNAIGVEPSAWAAEEGRRRYGVTIHATTLDRAPIEPGSCDAIHANHVLEHVVDPVAMLRVAARLLRPGGRLVLEVPQELRVPLSDRVFGSLHPELYPPRQPDPTHVEFFSRGGLRTAVERAGLSVERLETVRHFRNTESRLPAGRAVKELLIRAEEVLGTAPDLVVWARK
jgi:SAM-dependent methyltransferase